MKHKHNSYFEVAKKLSRCFSFLPITSLHFTSLYMVLESSKWRYVIRWAAGGDETICFHCLARMVIESLECVGRYTITMSIHVPVPVPVHGRCPDFVGTQRLGLSLLLLLLLLLLIDFDHIQDRIGYDNTAEHSTVQYSTIHIFTHTHRYSTVH